LIEPLRITLTVRCAPEHAFRTWTERATVWWPPEHTVSHDPTAEIVFEPRLGGRIYERTSTGREIEWGEVTAWNPPERLCYRWWIAATPADATEVEIRFRAVGAATEIVIEHGGWDRLGERGQPWRDANHVGWDGVLPAYARASAAAMTTIDED
jgi:hypothetical protein